MAFGPRTAERIRYVAVQCGYSRHDTSLLFSRPAQQGRLGSLLDSVGHAGEDIWHRRLGFFLLCSRQVEVLAMAGGLDAGIDGLAHAFLRC